MTRTCVGTMLEYVVKDIDGVEISAILECGACGYWQLRGDGPDEAHRDVMVLPVT